MKKKLVSLLLAGSVVASMAAIASVSASAIIDSNGCYAPGDNVTCGTHRYYFALPNTWLCEFTDTAGAYWYNGTDACGAVDGSGGDLKWPGYKAQRDEFKTDYYGVYYVDCPTDVPQIIWNNYVDGGEDKEAPIYLTAKQTNDAPTQFYSVFDYNETYDEDWFAEMEESYNGDKAALGDYVDNFFYDTEYDSGFSLNFDNMIFVAPAQPNGENFQGKPVYNGEWYFYFGDGLYGTYPTLEASKAACTLKDLKGAPATNEQPDPTTPGGSTNPDPGQNKPGDSGNDPYDQNKPGQPSPDATSSTKPASSDTAANAASNGSVQTGEVAYAAILLVVLAAVSGVVVFTRKKFN